MLKQINSLSISPPPPIQLLADDSGVSVLFQDVNNVSYYKDGFCTKCNINKVPTVVYQIPWFKIIYNKHELWRGKLP